MDGWIKISRSITDHWIFSNAVYFKWWIDMLLMANFRDNKVVVGARLMDLNRGQIVASLNFLATRWKVSKERVRRFLKLLQSENMIVINHDGKATQITVCNYASYQDVRDDSETTTSQQRDDSETTTRTNIRKKEGKKERIEEDNLGVNNLTPSSSESDAAEPPVVVDLKKSEKKPIDFKALADFFNNYMKDAAIPQIKMISPKRQQAVYARAGEYGMDAVYTVIDKASKSNFLNGGGKKHFVASFDWMFGPMNFPKVLEGNYDNQTFENNNNHGNNGQFIDPQQARLEQYERNIREYVAGQLASLANEG